MTKAEEEEEDKYWEERGEDELEADNTIKEMENLLEACNSTERNDQSEETEKPQTNKKKENAAQVDDQTENSKSSKREATNVLAEALKRTPKPVTMPTGSLPNSNTAPFWMSQLAAALSASSVYTDFKEYAWIFEVMDKTKDELAEPGAEYVKLDQLLAISAAKVLSKELIWEYTSLTEEMALRHRPVAGRQIIWIIINATKSTEADAYITSYENLKEMPWYGDQLYQIVAFYWEWKRLRQNMAKDVPEATIRNILYEKINNKSREYTDDMAHYVRCKDISTQEKPHADYSLEYLERVLYRAVIRSREIKQRSDTKTALKIGKSIRGRGGNDDFDQNEPGAPAAEAKGRGRGADRDRGRGRGRKAGRGDKDPPPPKAHPEPRPEIRSKAEMEKFCTKFQFDKCPLPDAECPKKHHKLKRHEIEFLDGKIKKARERKGKGRGKGEDRSKSRPKSETGRAPNSGVDWIMIKGKKVPYVCMAYMKDKCDYEERTGKACQWAHMSKKEFESATQKLNQEFKQ